MEGAQQIPVDAGSPLLDAGKVFSAQDIPEMVRVEVPEWGGHLYVKMMSGKERDRWELSVSDGVENRAQANIRGLLVAMCACRPDGKRIFTDNQASQLGDKSGAALDRVFAVAKKLNKILDKDIEELEKN